MKIRNEPLYTFVRWLVRNTFFRAVGGLESVHQERIPLEGGLIVAPNHVSHLDPPATSCAMYRRKICFMAKEELFRGLFGKLIRSLGAFPVKRGEGDTEAIRLTVGLLEQGQAVLIFPEGTRGDGEGFQAINRGPAMLAKRTGAKVLPVGIIGTHKVLPKGASKPKRHRVKVVFGEPFTYEEIARGGSEKENRELFAQELQRRIVTLCNENGLPLKTSSNTELSEMSDPVQKAAEQPRSL